MNKIEILVEEASAEEALRHLMPRLLYGRMRYKVINLGSKHKLLKVLSARLAAYRQRIENGESLYIIVLVDRDSDNCEKLKGELERISRDNRLPTSTAPDARGHFRVLNRIVIEELESWFIGDPPALRRAFTSLPRIDGHKGIFRNPDNGGSWEALHRFLKKNGIYKNSYPKIEAARRIAPHLNINSNRSPSFQTFVSGVESIIA